MNTTHVSSLLPRILPQRLGTAPKILFYYLDFGAVGGIERYIQQAVLALKARGQFEPVVACSADTPFYQRLLAEGVRVYGIRSAPLFRRSFLRALDVSIWRQLEVILQQEKPALIHVHIGLAENLLLRKMAGPVVFTFHGYGSLYSLGNTGEGVGAPVKFFYKRFTRWLFRQTAGHLDALLFISRSEQMRMLSAGYLPAENVGTVLNNGVPVDTIRQAALAANQSGLRQAWGIPEDARCVAFIGRLDENKNPMAFIELARRFSGRRPPASRPLHFIIAGDGPLAGDVKKASAAMPNLHYVGTVENVYFLLGICECVVHLARQEGFGLGVLEAMAAGIPCLAYASGGVPELLDSGFCLIPVNDLDAMAKRLAELLDGPQASREELGLRLLQRARRFDQSRWVDGLEAAYRRAAPLVSVILPVYNGEDSVLYAAWSVLNQNYRHLELIIVDDGSSDTTPRRLARLAKSDPRVRVIRQANRGVAAARNNGLGEVRGEYIAFIDADDVWLPQKLSTELAASRRNAPPGDPACIVYSGYYAVDEAGRLIHKPPIRRVSGDCAGAVVADEGMFLPSATLMHRSVYEELGGFDEDCYHEDRAFFIRACQRFPAYPTGRRLVLYQQAETGRCRRVLTSFEEAFLAELSIAETLRPDLPPERLARLEAVQQRNLFYRFLMYGQISHARRLYSELRKEQLEGVKGWLARLSMWSGVNLLQAARMVVQGWNRQVLSGFVCPEEYFHADF